MSPYEFRAACIPHWSITLGTAFLAESEAMATFYILPPRANLEGSLGELLGQVLPGLPLPMDTWDIIAEKLASTAQWPTDVFLIPRDDLPDLESVQDALIEGFGAEPGDRVLEVGMRNGSRAWTLAAPAMSAAATAR